MDTNHKPTWHAASCVCENCGWHVLAIYPSLADDTCMYCEKCDTMRVMAAEWHESGEVARLCEGGAEMRIYAEVDKTPGADSPEGRAIDGLEAEESDTND